MTVEGTGYFAGKETPADKPVVRRFRDHRSRAASQSIWARGTDTNDLRPDFSLICGPDFLRKLRSWCYCYVTAEWKNWHESEKKVTQIVRSVAREGKKGLVVKTSDAGKPLNWSCGKKLPNNIGLVAKRQTDFPGRLLLKLDLSSGFVFLKFSNELESTPSATILRLAFRHKRWRPCL